MKYKNDSDFIANTPKSLQNKKLNLKSVNKGVFRYLGQFNGKEIVVEAYEDCVSNIDFELQETVVNLIFSDSCTLTVDGDVYFSNE